MRGGVRDPPGSPGDGSAPPRARAQPRSRAHCAHTRGPASPSRAAPALSRCGALGPWVRQRVPRAASPEAREGPGAEAEARCAWRGDGHDTVRAGVGRPVRSGPADSCEPAPHPQPARSLASPGTRQPSGHEPYPLGSAPQVSCRTPAPGARHLRPAPAKGAGGRKGLGRKVCP